MRSSHRHLALALLAFAFSSAFASTHADDLASLCADRAALERVYHSHRLGTKVSFEQAMPAALIEQLVRLDLHKKTVLAKTYGVTLTPAQIAAEVERIDATTRAPEVLAELKRALADDPARFAASMARPLVVERELRRRFENDDALHAPQRRTAEQARTRLLAGESVENLREITWQLTPRPPEAAPAAAPALAITPTQVVAQSSTYTVEATAQLSQALSAPSSAPTHPAENKNYFEDLDPELQPVLLAQLQKPGDVSAVIETPVTFLVFAAKARNSETLSASSLTLPKRSYEEWLVLSPLPPSRSIAAP